MHQLTRTIAIAAALTAGATTVAMPQRGRGGGGVMGVPRITTSQPAPQSAASPTGRVPLPSPRGTITVPRAPLAPYAQDGGLPRIVTEPRHQPRSYSPSGPSSGHGRAYDRGSSYGNYPRRGGAYRRPPYTRWGVGAGCGYGCYRPGAGIHKGGFYGSFLLGYPFAVPLYLPHYVVESTQVQYEEATVEAYDARPEPQSYYTRPAAKLIVVGGGTGGGDAVSVETVGDSVRLRWLGAGRSAREVRLFVADSARRELASRTASPSAPVATFEIVTLSAPVAFTGVSVTFTDGVTMTTVIPYQHAAASRRR